MRFFKHCIVFIAAFFMLTGMARAGVPHVGILRVPDGSAPSEYYSLMRDGQVVSSADLFQNMKVRNGDIIQPEHGKAPVLVYVTRECGTDLEITKETKVQCTAEPKKGSVERFVTFLYDIPKGFLKQKVSRKATTLTWSVTTRGEGTSCYPDDFSVTPWPPEGSTLLADSGSVQFRDEFSPRNCAGGTLQIREEGSSVLVMEEPYQTGALLELPVIMTAGQQYKWEVQVLDEGEKFLSDVRYFSVLSDRQSAQIREELQRLSRFYQDRELLLAQAGYLQYLSDNDEELDLYAESARLLRQYRAMQSAVDHCEFISLWKKLSPVNNSEKDVCR